MLNETWLLGLDKIDVFVQNKLKKICLKQSSYEIELVVENYFWATKLFNIETFYSM